MTRARLESPFDPMRTALKVFIVVLAIGVITLVIALIGTAIQNGTEVVETGGVRFVRAMPTPNAGEAAQISPTSVTISPGGDLLWCTDPPNNRLVAFDRTGTRVEVFTHDLTGILLESPSSVAITSDGWFYVVEPTFGRVAVFDTQRQLRQKLIMPVPLAVAVSDELVAVGCKSGFALFDRSGNHLVWEGTLGSGEDQFDSIGGIAIDGYGYIYVVDTNNARLSKFDQAGQRVWTTDLKNDNRAGDKHLMGATLDGAGRLLVADNAHSRIHAFTIEDGFEVEQWGMEGTEFGQFNRPTDICYTPQDNTFAVADYGNERIQIVRVSGCEPIGMFGIPQSMLNRVDAIAPFLLLLGSLLCLGFANRKSKKSVREHEMMLNWQEAN